MSLGVNFSEGQRGRSALRLRNCIQASEYKAAGAAMGTQYTAWAPICDLTETQGAHQGRAEFCMGAYLSPNRGTGRPSGARRARRILYGRAFAT